MDRHVRAHPGAGPVIASSDGGTAGGNGYAAHPESLPLDWEDKAYLIREGALYVDLREDGWHTPDQFVVNDYTALRLQAVHYLQGVTAAFERHKQLHAERKKGGGAA